jgi:hypothetical protein
MIFYHIIRKWYNCPLMCTIVYLNSTPHLITFNSNEWKLYTYKLLAVFSLSFTLALTQMSDLAARTRAQFFTLACSSSMTQAQILTPNPCSNEEYRIAYGFSSTLPRRLWKLFILFLLNIASSGYNTRHIEPGLSSFVQMPWTELEATIIVLWSCTSCTWNRYNYSSCSLRQIALRERPSAYSTQWMLLDGLALEHLRVPLQSTHYVCRGQHVMVALMRLFPSNCTEALQT